MGSTGQWRSHSCAGFITVHLTAREGGSTISLILFFRWVVCIHGRSDVTLWEWSQSFMMEERLRDISGRNGKRAQGSRDIKGIFKFRQTDRKESGGNHNLTRGEI